MTNSRRSTCDTWSAAEAALARDERLYRFEFPERPGALMRFLSSMHPNWNISLFHYRNQGADYGRILVGIQVPTARSLRSRNLSMGWLIRASMKPKILLIVYFFVDARSGVHACAFVEYCRAAADFIPGSG